MVRPANNPPPPVPHESDGEARERIKALVAGVVRSRVEIEFAELQRIIEWCEQRRRAWIMLAHEMRLIKYIEMGIVVPYFEAGALEPVLDVTADGLDFVGGPLNLEGDDFDDLPVPNPF